jgi:serine protease AprX
VPEQGSAGGRYDKTEDGIRPAKRPRLKYTVGVSVVGGSVGNVSLTVAGLPAGTTAVFSPNPVASPGSSALTVKTTSSTRRGTYTLQITGTSGSLVHTITVILTVR